MKKMFLVPVQGAPNAYMLAYDYKLFPLKETPNAFELKVQLPFEGMDLAVPGQGGRGVRLTVLTPIDANVDQVMTKGIDQPVMKYLTKMSIQYQKPAAK